MRSSGEVLSSRFVPDTGEVIRVQFASLPPDRLRRGFDSTQELFCLDDAQAKQVVSRDQSRLQRVLNFVQRRSTLSVLQEIYGQATPSIAHLAQRVRFDHQALLLASDPSLVSYWLFDAGFRTGTLIGSVNVVQRLQVRHHHPCPVAILRTKVHTLASDVRQIELFFPSPEPGRWTFAVVDEEQTQEHEAHTAVTLHPNADYRHVLSRLLDNGLVLDGQQTINPAEHSSTQYLHHPLTHRRLELIHYFNSQTS